MWVKVIFNTHSLGFKVQTGTSFQAISSKCTTLYNGVSGELLTYMNVGIPINPWAQVRVQDSLLCMILPRMDCSHFLSKDQSPLCGNFGKCKYSHLWRLLEVLDCERAINTKRKIEDGSEESWHQVLWWCWLRLYLVPSFDKDRFSVSWPYLAVTNEACSYSHIQYRNVETFKIEVHVFSTTALWHTTESII